MKNICLSIFAVFIISCKQTSDKKEVSFQKEETVSVSRTYPENISKIFDTHGGLTHWNNMQSMEFTIPGETGDEVTTSSLKDRKSLIRMPNHSIGYNGKEVWLHSKDTTAYKGNPKFYYNLMFYFYTMPFVLADDGIVYEDVEPLIFEGKSYPGIKISYDAGVGESPDDEYILYYDSETNTMAWLAYTVTYFSKEKSKAFRFIKYGDWQTVEGLLLPKTLTWYNYENHVPTSARSDRAFTNVMVSGERPSDTLFEVPEGAKIIE